MRRYCLCLLHRAVDGGHGEGKDVALLSPQRQHSATHGAPGPCVPTERPGTVASELPWLRLWSEQPSSWSGGGWGFGLDGTAEPSVIGSRVRGTGHLCW